MIPSGVRRFGRLGDVVAWGIAGAAVLAYMMVQGSTLREAAAIGAGGALFAALVVTVGNGVLGRGPLARVKSAAVAGGDLIVLGDLGIRARRLADGAVAPSPSSVPDSTADEVRLEREVLYGDGAARLWLTGEHRRALHGLQPQPAQPPEFINGELMVTKAIVARSEGFPILVRHRRSLAPDADHLLTSLALDGTTRWTASFPALGLAHAAFLFADAERVVLVTSSRDDDCEAIVLDATSGRIAWRRRL
jgi:hypothetical protein